jgi:hypothetical protein
MPPRSDTRRWGTDRVVPSGQGISCTTGNDRALVHILASANRQPQAHEFPCLRQSNTMVRVLGSAEGSHNRCSTPGFPLHGCAVGRFRRMVNGASQTTPRHSNVPFDATTLLHLMSLRRMPIRSAHVSSPIRQNLAQSSSTARGRPFEADGFWRTPPRATATRQSLLAAVSTRAQAWATLVFSPTASLSNRHPSAIVIAPRGQQVSKLLTPIELVGGVLTRTRAQLFVPANRRIPTFATAGTSSAWATGNP